jgi:hypothetical protein
MREIWLTEGLHVGRAVTALPCQNWLGVVFLHVFGMVSIPNGVRPPPININGHGRLKGDHNRIYHLHFYLFTFLSLYFSNPMFCSSTTSVA